MSGGISLQLETTSLTLINWIIQDKDLFAKEIELGVKFVVSSMSKGGRYGSTQSTVLCLQALNRYLDEKSGVRGEGQFVLTVDGAEVAAVPFNESNTKYDLAGPL